MAVGDLNGDGKPDLVVANYGSDTVSVLLNTTTPGAATPSFAAKQDFTTGTDPVSVAVGDLNGDGKPDLAVANYGSNTVSVLLNTTAPGAATPSFAGQARLHHRQPSRSPWRWGTSTATASRTWPWRTTASNTVSVLLNTTTPGAATPSFAAKQDFTTGSESLLRGGGGPQRRRQAGPGRGELRLQHRVGVAEHDPPGAATPSFAAKQDFTTGSDPISVAVADLNGDGKPDLVVANYGSNTVSVLLNTTTPGAATPSFAAKQDFTTGSDPCSVAVGDINGDGKPDLVVANMAFQHVSVLLNTTTPGAATPSFAAKQDFTTGSSPVLRGGGGPQRRRQAGPGRGEL